MKKAAANVILAVSLAVCKVVLASKISLFTSTLWRLLATRTNTNIPLLLSRNVLSANMVRTLSRRIMTAVTPLVFRLIS
ncbi:hypothetical protein TorRG33x02_019050 [Trema orientale]|uniref:Uncharacterized protein n=1 Tax=Trema orientale TaxID=63057 RepID=A0A2P5FWD5_TREOI|nr:hypothetical protein TorRG33x02_019050 [Trema orientale]